MKIAIQRATAAIALCGLAWMGGVQAAGDAAAGKDKAAMCAGCHGDDGNSMAPDFPRLAGQYANYIVKQVLNFQAGMNNPDSCQMIDGSPWAQGRCNNDTMAGMAVTVASKEDLEDIAAYFSSQKMANKPISPVDSKLVEKGKQIFLEGNPKSGVYGCVNCHGVNGKGKDASNAVFPIIGGQHKDYIVKQLTDFREGRRMNDPAGMMTGIAKKLTDAEIEAVANYLADR